MSTPKPLCARRQTVRLSAIFPCFLSELIGPRCLPELAFRVAGLVYDEVGGDPSKRPSEFL